MRRKKINEIYVSRFISILENLNVYVAKGDSENTINVLQPGFKIIHKKSGLTYTIDKFILEDIKNPVILAHRYDDDGDRVNFEIEEKNFKEYERL